MINYLRALLTSRLENLEERGASAVEYGLLLGGIAILVIAAVVLLGPHIASMFKNTNTSLTNNMSAATS